MTQMPSTMRSPSNPPPLSGDLLKAVCLPESVLPLSMPMTLVLNTTGLSMLKNRSAQGDKGLSGYELPVSVFKPDMVRKLLMKNCLNRIDVRLDDVISHRKDILDLSKLLSFSMIYRQFRRELLEKTLATTMIRNWNRNNPRQKLDAFSEASMEGLEKRLRARGEQVELFQRNMLILLWQNSYSQFQGDDQMKKLGMAQKLIAEIHPLTLYLLLDYGKNDEIRELYRQTVSLIASYVKRFDLPEYNALILLEFLQSSEREYLLTLYNRILKTGGHCLDDYPMNDQIRGELIKRKITPNIRFSFLFETRNSSSRGQAYRIKTLIYCAEKESREINDILFHRDNSKLDRRGVRDYLEQDGRCDDSYNPEILYYYMSHLEQACRQTGGAFSSFVNTRAEMTVTHLIFDS